MIILLKKINPKINANFQLYLYKCIHIKYINTQERKADFVDFDKRETKRFTSLKFDLDYEKRIHSSHIHNSFF